MYKLDAIDAYERKLVKQIEVASVTSEDDCNTPYIKLLSVDNKKKPYYRQSRNRCNGKWEIKEKIHNCEAK